MNNKNLLIIKNKRMSFYIFYLENVLKYSIKWVNFYKNKYSLIDVSNIIFIEKNFDLSQFIYEIGLYYDKEISEEKKLYNYTFVFKEIEPFSDKIINWLYQIIDKRFRLLYDIIKILEKDTNIPDKNYEKYIMNISYFHKLILNSYWQEFDLAKLLQFLERNYLAIPFKKKQNIIKKLIIILENKKISNFNDFKIEYYKIYKDI